MNSDTTYKDSEGSYIWAGGASENFWLETIRDTSSGLSSPWRLPRDSKVLFFPIIPFLAFKYLLWRRQQLELRAIPPNKVQISQGLSINSLMPADVREKQDKRWRGRVCGMMTRHISVAEVVSLTSPYYPESVELPSELLVLSQQGSLHPYFWYRT